MAIYKCYSCMKVFSAQGPYPDVASGGSCRYCRTLITDAVNRIDPPPPRLSLLEPGFWVYLHNDDPPLTGRTKAVRINTLVFRGDGVAYEDLNPPGFQAKADRRFDHPYIIRDSWIEKNVTTHMQTKAVLAWSKSIYKALEYALGCVKGGMGGKKYGYLYFAWVEYGVDVVDTVRAWELAKTGLGRIAAGTQEEVLSPTLPISRLIGCWRIDKSSTFGEVIIKARSDIATDHFPSTIVRDYRYYADMFPLDKAFTVYARTGGLRRNDDAPCPVEVQASASASVSASAYSKVE